MAEHNESDTFTEWMEEHRGIVTKIIRGFTYDSSDAEDLQQEISIAIWRSISSFRGDAKPSTWIWRIALNVAISSKRKRSEAAVPLDHLPEPAARDRSADALLLDRIYDAIRTLSPVDRSLVMLSLDGMTYSEMADITGLSQTNVGARLSRARTRLSQQLEHQDELS